MTAKPAAFRATVHGFRTIPSRGVVSVTIEAPIEQHAEIARIAEHGVWVAVARLDPSKVSQQEEASDDKPRPTTPSPSRTEKAGARPENARPFSSLPLSQQAALACDRAAFRRFLADTYKDSLAVDLIGIADDDPAAMDLTAELVRTICGIKSRRELDSHPAKAARWRDLYTAFQSWLNDDPPLAPEAREREREVAG